MLPAMLLPNIRNIYKITLKNDLYYSRWTFFAFPLDFFSKPLDFFPLFSGNKLILHRL